LWQAIVEDDMAARWGRGLAGLAGAAWLAAGPALATGAEPAATAKPAPSANVSGITVTAPQKPNPLVDPTNQFVRQHLPESTFSEQYPRFRDEVCVRVIGLPPEFNAFVVKRIAEVAERVHAPVSMAAGCKPNVDVIFSPQPQAQIADIAKRKDILVGFYWNESHLKRLATFKGPVGAWYVTATRDQFGDNRLEKHDPTDYRNPRVGRAGSRLSNGMSAELEHSLIIADTSKVAGEKIDAVADYVAVLALARWDGLERCNAAVPTILNLMAEGCSADTAPEAATPADLALLTALYAVDPRELGAHQRMSIASRMRGEMKKATAAEEAHWEGK
jgi:hypothetical protein